MLCSELGRETQSINKTLASTAGAFAVDMPNMCVRDVSPRFLFGLSKLAAIHARFA